MPLIGRSAAMQEVYRVMARLMHTDLTVMITGESGTGKELVARALHDYGQRRKGAFVAINMAAIPRELIESELFGHEKGAFTGAQARIIGRFEQADGGTLFLDEIGDMPMEAQTRLLRVLQEGEYMTVGGRTPIKTDVRIVAATNKNLDEQIAPGAVPRRPVITGSTWCRCGCRLCASAWRTCPTSCIISCKLAEKSGLPHKSDPARSAGAAEAPHLAGQCPRAGKSGAAADRALSRRKSSRADIIENELATASRRGWSCDSRRSGQFDANGWRGISPIISPASARICRRRAFTTAFCARWRAPLITAALAATRGNQIKAAELLGLNRNTLRKKIREQKIRVIRTPS